MKRLIFWINTKRANHSPINFVLALLLFT
uniref:Uncharacterized protein n=1 Tax=Anguilla anguilla TaxID=7936 RepID=A0A0E9TLF3_ANGAN